MSFIAFCTNPYIPLMSMKLSSRLPTTPTASADGRYTARYLLIQSEDQVRVWYSETCIKRPLSCVICQQNLYKATTQLCDLPTKPA